MLQRLIGKLFGLQKDPTADWPILVQSTPEVDCTRRMVSSMHFGDPWTVARQFGRPDRFRWIQPGYCELIYAQAGWQMDFDQDRFAYVAFFIGPDCYVPTMCPPISFSRPHVDGMTLSCETTQAQVEQKFGPPRSRDRDEDETILFYAGSALTLEFELTPAGNLKRLNIYPT
jgi:hypothetical protein